MPEVQRAVDHNKNAVRVLLLELLGMDEMDFQERARKRLSKMERLFIQCIDKIEVEGDVLRLRALLEVSLGRIPDQQESIELSPDERHLVRTFRERLEKSKE